MALVYSLSDYNYSIEDSFLYENRSGYSKPDKRLSIQLDGVMKRLFNLKNKIPIIDFLNAAYNDDISYNAKIIYGDKEISNINRNTARMVNFFADMYIHVEDDAKVYEYEIEFQTRFQKGLIIRMFRYGFERAVKLLDYSIFDNSIIEINVPQPYIIVIEEQGDVPDKLQLKINFSKGEYFTYVCNILKYYEKEVDTLKENNMYLLLPLSIVKLRKDMDRLSRRKSVSEEERNSILLRLKDTVEKTLLILDTLYNKDKITLEDYDDMVTVMENIASYLENNYSKFNGIEEEVTTMVKSFYDPKVEEKGIEKGIERGAKKSNELLIKQIMKRFGNIPDEVKERIMNLPTEKVNEIGEAIFDFKSMEDIVKLL